MPQHERGRLAVKVYDVAIRDLQRRGVVLGVQQVCSVQCRGRSNQRGAVWVLVVVKLALHPELVRHVAVWRGGWIPRDREGGPLSLAPLWALNTLGGGFISEAGRD